jgi:uncharacterized membrane-anchored protein YitT (DUF2179 family)
MKKYFADIAVLIVGAFLFALAVNLFIVPNDFGEGGGQRSFCTTCSNGRLPW